MPETMTQEQRLVKAKIKRMRESVERLERWVTKDVPLHVEHEITFLEQCCHGLRMLVRPEEVICLACGGRGYFDGIPPIPCQECAVAELPICDVCDKPIRDDESSIEMDGGLIHRDCEEGYDPQAEAPL